MKEYLVKRDDEYVLVNADHMDDAIEVPDGALSLLYSRINYGLMHFTDKNNKLMSVEDIQAGVGNWYGDADNYTYKCDTVVLWQRVEFNKEPIQQEYLNKTSEGWKLVILEDGQTEDENLIRIPEGATTATISDEGSILFWRKDDENFCFNPTLDRRWFTGAKELENYLKYWEGSKIIWEREVAYPAEKQYTSELGKLYQDTNLKRNLDNIFTDMYNYIEFEIKSGNTIPFEIKHDKLHTLPDDARAYLTYKLSEVGCIGDIVDPDSPVYVVSGFK